MSRKEEEVFLLRNCWSIRQWLKLKVPHPPILWSCIFSDLLQIFFLRTIHLPPLKPRGFGNLCIFSFQPWELKLLGFIISWCSLVELQNGPVAFLASFDDRRHVTEYKLLFRKRYRCATSDVRYTVVTVAENGFGVERGRCQHAPRDTSDLQGRQHN